jgi:hypothetical protein
VIWLNIKPIETRYAGCRFRSRLEARWAVFFDTLGIAWEYEPQGFELGPLPASLIEEMKNDRFREPEDADSEHLGYYLPDFWLPGQEAWIEVKGTELSEQEWNRLYRFFELVGQRSFVAVGNIPDPRTINAIGHPYGSGFEIHTYGDHHYAWTRCLWCGFYDIAFDARSARTRCGCHAKHYAGAPCCNGDKCYNGDEPSLLVAYEAARSARFEYGEKP